MNQLMPCLIGEAHASLNALTAREIEPVPASLTQRRGDHHRAARSPASEDEYMCIGI